jgi:hypothetical protein
MGFFFICITVSLYFCLSLCLCVSLSLCLSVSLSLCLSVSLSLCLSSPSRQSLGFSVYLSLIACLSVCLSVFVSLSIHRPIYEISPFEKLSKDYLKIGITTTCCSSLNVQLPLKIILGSITQSASSHIQ